VRAFPDDLHVVCGTEQVGEAPSDELMVVEDEDADDAFAVLHRQRDRPSQPRSSLFLVLQSQRATPTVSTVPEVDQPTAPGVVAEPDPIIAKSTFIVCSCKPCSGALSNGVVMAAERIWDMGFS
jgi:hypothetical protein